MYHYLESGLRNIWLENGFREIDTPEGKALAVDNVEGLHRAIGSTLLAKAKLTGAEFRFLRKELGLSQANAGSLLGVSTQSVALWEKHGRLPGPAERLMRVIYKQKLEKNPDVILLLKKLNELDRSFAERLSFAQRGETWRLAA